MKSQKHLLAFLSALVLSASLNSCAIHTAPAPQSPNLRDTNIQTPDNVAIPRSPYGTIYKKHNKNYCYSCPRDSHGRIKRSAKAKHEFMKMTGYPHGRPGYIIDHIIPLKEGGADAPSNMQWQTLEEAKAKDKVE